MCREWIFSKDEHESENDPQKDADSRYRNKKKNFFKYMKLVPPLI